MRILLYSLSSICLVVSRVMEGKNNSLSLLAWPCPPLPTELWTIVKVAITAMNCQTDAPRMSSREMQPCYGKSIEGKEEKDQEKNNLKDRPFPPLVQSS